MSRLNIFQLATEEYPDVKLFRTINNAMFDAERLFRQKTLIVAQNSKDFVIVFSKLIKALVVYINRNLNILDFVNGEIIHSVNKIFTSRLNEDPLDYSPLVTPI